MDQGLIEAAQGPSHAHRRDRRSAEVGEQREPVQVADIQNDRDRTSTMIIVRAGFARACWSAAAAAKTIVGVLVVRAPQPGAFPAEHR